jgi:hypothetical protein
MLTHSTQLPRRDLAIVVAAVVLGSLATFGGIYWLGGGLRVACGCPGGYPLGAYYQLGPVAADPYRASPYEPAYQATVMPAPVLEPSGVNQPAAPPLSSLSFQVQSPSGTNFAISVVCALGSNGTVLGTWLGSTGNWAHEPSGSPVGCGATAPPGGNLPPGSNALDVGSVLIFYMEQGAVDGSTFTVAVANHPGGTAWTGSISQTFASGGVVWERATPV